MRKIIKCIDFLGQGRFFNQPWLLFLLKFLLKYIFKYRKKVIDQNLKNAFPEKSKIEIKTLTSQYYDHLIKLIFEILNSYYIDSEEISGIISFKNELKVQEIIDQNESFIFTSGHSGNWELVNLFMALNFKQEIRAIYQPMSNEIFNDYILNKRSRFGTKMYPKIKDISSKIFEDNSKSFALALINDQSPKPELAYWTMFLNQETGFYRGPAELALKYNLPLVFMHVNRLINGKYEVISELIQNRNSVEEILEEYVRKLEENIKKDPVNWLWSHRRWKHKRPVL